MNRFECEKNIAVNNVSNTIYISNLEDSISEKTLLFYILPFGEVLKIQ